MRTAARDLVVGLLLLVLVGGQGAVLQTVAWAGMLAARVPGQGWAGVRGTFDGTKPCALCLVVRDLDAAPPAQPLKSKATQKLVKMEASLAAVPVVAERSAESGRWDWPASPARPRAVRDGPEPPPPRG